MGNIVDTLIVFRILKLLTTPFKDSKAYELGFIDANGQRIKYKQSETNKNQKIENNPTTSAEKESYTYLHRLVFNLKRIIEKVPFGKSKFASYAAALALIKEHVELTNLQTDMLHERWAYQMGLNESYDSDHPSLTVGETVNLIHEVVQNGVVFAAREECVILEKYGTYFSVDVFMASTNGQTIMVTAYDTY